MRCLVLGGAGFIGSHLAEALVARGDHVRVLAKPSTDLRNIAPLLPDIDLRKGDFLNEGDLEAALEGIEFVFHLAATTLPSSSNDDVVYDVKTNVVGTLNLLNRARQSAVRKIVFASSGGTVYGIPHSLPLAETHPTEPLCSYGVTKLTCERYLSLYKYLHELDYAILRMANAFGPRQNPAKGQGVVAAFLAKLMRDEAVTIWGDGSIERDFVYIDDIVRAFVRTIDAVPSPIYNIGSGTGHSINAVLGTVAEVTGRRPKVLYTASRKVDVPRNSLDISLAGRELDWRPAVTLREGIARTWAAMQRDAALPAR